MTTIILHNMPYTLVMFKDGHWPRILGHGFSWQWPPQIIGQVLYPGTQIVAITYWWSQLWYYMPPNAANWNLWLWLLSCSGSIPINYNNNVEIWHPIIRNAKRGFDSIGCSGDILVPPPGGGGFRGAPVLSVKNVSTALPADGWRRRWWTSRGCPETRASWIPSCEVRLVHHGWVFITQWPAHLTSGNHKWSSWSRLRVCVERVDGWSSWSLSFANQKRWWSVSVLIHYEYKVHYRIHSGEEQ